MKKHITVNSIEKSNLGKESLYIGEATNVESVAALKLNNGVLHLPAIEEWSEEKLGKTLLINGVLQKDKSKSKDYFFLKSPKELDAK